MINKKKIIYLLLIITVVGIYYFYDETQAQTREKLNLEKEPIYESSLSHSYFYDFEGKLDYSVIAHNVKHYEFNNSSTFIDPEIIFFNSNKQASWRVVSERAMLLNNQFFLYDEVDILSLLPDSPLKEILTTNAVVELTKKIATSDDPVTIYGNTLISNGVGVIASLHDKTADILNDVKSSFLTESQKEDVTE